MRKSSFEHGFVTQACALPQGWGGLSPGHLTEVLGTKLHDIVAGLDDSLAALDGGGWEVVSHNTMAINGMLVTSFLIRRARPVEDESAGRRGGASSRRGSMK